DDKIRKHSCNVWLSNTGWTGGPHGEGHRIALPYTRKMLSEALHGNLDNIAYEADPIFDLAIPQSVSGVPNEVLIRRNTWSDPKAYDAKAEKLANMFTEKFQQFKGMAKAEITKAGPKV